ncbi:M23 family metallopeptidase [Thermocoleostomius sinensis]|uniref:M23 family metallopeptidase n=1 Tax=Thermocoleostomius sinensis A174 TaxID=2016057 RepID=A0A9E8ZJ79_9CYAN|nr:M23 family metallopeptidase [Thermocoleostomius sinensis]WAL62742.1 M23 family metallopeptidase [Thermocoleostomius sinensis A174]
MNRRKPTSYTIWIAGTGREPIVLSLRPFAIILGVGLPAILVSALLVSFVRENLRLSQRNSQLTEEAAGILQQLEALESSISNLQERANQSETPNSEVMPNELTKELTKGARIDAVVDEAFDGELDTIDSDQLDDNNAPDEDAFNDDWNDWRGERQGPPDDNLSQQSAHGQIAPIQGGVGGSIAAEELLELAKAKLPELVEELQGEVEPALQAMFVREEAKPRGVPLQASDTEITSLFGLRPNPFGWGYEFHRGIDFVAAYGSPVYATASGRVSKAEWESGFGNYIIVDHGYGYETLYAHLSEIKVNTGARIDRHQVLGYLGNTGRSSGPHLHYSVFRNGQVVDPKKYLD